MGENGGIASETKCSTSSNSLEAIVDSNSVNHQVSDLGKNCEMESSDFRKVMENKESWVINVKCEDFEVFDGEKVCRICHLNSEQPLKSGFSRSKSDLIMLGCGCKGELSFAHLHCAEAWFKLKGNRICEICGQMVTNLRGVGNEGFMEEWKEGRSNRNVPNSSDSSQEEGCWHGQPLCNFLIACLVIAFIIPWFFRINFW